MSDIAAIQGIDSELDGFWGGEDSSGPMLGIILATPPSGCGLQRVEPGAGFYLKHYCSMEFDQSGSSWPVYMLESPLFTPWSPLVSPALPKCRFCALYTCEFLETPPTLLSMLVNEPVPLLPLAVSVVHPAPAGRVDFLAGWCCPTPPCSQVEPLPS